MESSLSSMRHQGPPPHETPAPAPGPEPPTLAQCPLSLSLLFLSILWSDSETGSSHCSMDVLSLWGLISHYDFNPIIHSPSQIKSLFPHSYSTAYFSSPCRCTGGSSPNLSKNRVLDFLSPTTSNPHLPHLSNDPTSHSDPTAQKARSHFCSLSSLLHIQVFRKSSICPKTS